MVIIRKGDAYALPVLIKSDDTAITAADVSGVRIGIGSIVASYPDGQLRYEGGYWLLPITQAQSYTLPQGDVYYQAQIQLATGETLSSPRQKVHIDSSIFRQPWGKLELDDDASDAAAVVAQIDPKPESITAEIQQFSAGGQQTAADEPYTTLSKALYVDPNNTGYRTSRITVHLHNLDPARTYKLRLFTVSRRKGQKYGVWYSPLNYDETAPAGEGKYHIGYAGLVGTPITTLDNKYADGETRVWQEVPSWMPYGGRLLTRWDVIPQTGRVEIDLGLWLLPICKPYAFSDVDVWGGEWVELDNNPGLLVGRLIGIGKSAQAGKLLRWCLVDDRGKVYPTRNTLNVSTAVAGDVAVNIPGVPGETAESPVGIDPSIPIIKSSSLHTRII